MGLMDHFDGLVSVFDNWFENGWLLLAIPVAIAIVIYLIFKTL